MAQENNQNGQKSTFDRAHDAVNKIRSADKNVKRVLRTVRTAQATAQTLIGGFSPIIWAVVGAMIMIAASTVFLAMMGGGPGVSAGTPEEPPTVSVCTDISDGHCATSCDTTTEKENVDPLDCSTSGNKCCVPLNEEPPPIPPPSGNTPQFSIARRIGDALEKADYCSGYAPYNKQAQDITTSYGNARKSAHGSCSGNYGYVCTILIMDSYKLAGLKHAYNPLVRNMETNWENGWGGKVYYHSGCYFDNKPKNQNFDMNVLNSLQPGDVIFMHSADCKTMGHVAMVSEQPNIINGVGKIKFVNSNGPRAYDELQVLGGVIQKKYGASLFEFGFAPR